MIPTGNECGALCRIEYVGEKYVVIVRCPNVTTFWDRAPCSAYVNRRFGRTYHLGLAVCCMLVIALPIFDLVNEDMLLRNVCSHTDSSSITQKVATFITTAVRTSNLYMLSD
jgi:hypothetical protein